MIDKNPFAQYDADAVVWSIRAWYIFAAYAILIVRFIPDLRDRFLSYGARSHGRTDLRKPRESALPRWLRIQIDPVLDTLADFTVPHSWFMHFYICSTICSAFWMYNNRSAVINQSSALKLGASIPWEQRTMLCMVMMFCQGIRRLYECVFLAKSSNSRMWIGHYLIGLAFYVVTNIAIWVEPALYPENRVSHPKPLTPLAIFEILRIVVGPVFFFSYSYQQHQVHKYLGRLKDYRMPNHPIYRQTNLLCPHYGFEVNIYLALAIMSASDGRVFNLTMLCAVFFVVINLGVTADLTKKWMMEKFPKQRPEIASQKKMLGSIW